MNVLPLDVTRACRHSLGHVGSVDILPGRNFGPGRLTDTNGPAFNGAAEKPATRQPQREENMKIIGKLAPAVSAALIAAVLSTAAVAQTTSLRI